MEQNQENSFKSLCLFSFSFVSPLNLSFIDLSVKFATKVTSRVECRKTSLAACNYSVGTQMTSTPICWNGRIWSEVGNSVVMIVCMLIMSIISNGATLSHFS